MFFKFLESTAVVNGLSVDYLLPKIYLTDLIAIACVSFWIFDNRNKAIHWIKTKLVHKIKNNIVIIPIISLCILFFIRQFLTPHPLLAFLLFVKICLFILLGKIVINSKITKNKLFSQMLAVTIIFQSVIAFIQFFTQKSVYGFVFLGETNLQSYAGIARTTFFGVEKILPYGTTAHPNILAGFTALFMLMLIDHWMRHTQHRLGTLLNTLGTLLGIGTLILTQSLSALLAFLLGIFVLAGMHKKILTLGIARFLMLLLISTIVTITSIFFVSDRSMKNTSVNRRDYLNVASIQMSLENPVWGVGLGNFTHFVESVSTNSEVVRFVQPVHSVVLLFLSETGILGVILAFLLLKYCVGKTTAFQPLIVAVLPLAVLDHYLYTLQSGMLLTIFFVAYTLQEKNYG